MSNEHVPDAASRYLVETAAGFCTQEQVALLLKVSVATVKKYYSEELAVGNAKKVLQIARCQFDIATDPNNKSCAAVGMWWLERRGGDEWKPPEKRLKVEGGISVEHKQVIDSSKLTYDQRQKMKELLMDIEGTQKVLEQSVVAEQNKEG